MALLVVVVAAAVMVVVLNIQKSNIRFIKTHQNKSTHVRTVVDDLPVRHHNHIFEAVEHLGRGLQH